MKPQMVIADVRGQVSVAPTARVENSRIEIKGSSKLVIDDDVTVRDTLIVLRDSDLHISRGTVLDSVNMFAERNSTISIGQNSEIIKYDYMLYSARFSSDRECHFVQGRNALRPYFNITSGDVYIGDHNVIRADFWVRFGGQVHIGQYNCINERTEIRCDESVTIGSFNMISYDCSIWDTNTHCQYDIEKRRAKTIKDFPIIGKETERPKTKPIVIGDDCWVGKYATLLKGTTLNNQVTIGVRTLVSNREIPCGAKVVSVSLRVVEK